MPHGTKYILVVAIMLGAAYAALQFRRPVSGPPRTQTGSAANEPSRLTAQNVPAEARSAQRLPLTVLADPDRPPNSEARPVPATPSIVDKPPTVQRSDPKDSAPPSGDKKSGGASELKPKSKEQTRGSEKADDKKNKPQKPRANKAEAATGSSKPADSPAVAATAKKIAPARAGEPKPSSPPAPPVLAGQKMPATAGDPETLAAPPQLAQHFPPRPPLDEATPQRKPPAPASNLNAPQSAPTPPAPPRSGIRHRIAEGDTLHKLAERYLGSPDRYGEILDANREVLPDPRLLPLGVELVIPAGSVPTAPSRATAPAPIPPTRAAPLAASSPGPPSATATGMAPIPPQALPPLRP